MYILNNVLSKVYLQKVVVFLYLFISTFTLTMKSGCNMQFLHHIHPCFFCCPRMKISSLINEKRMTGCERQSCTCHEHISFFVYIIISFFRHILFIHDSFMFWYDQAHFSWPVRFWRKQIQSHQGNGSSPVIGPWTWSFMSHVDLNSLSWGKRSVWRSWNKKSEQVHHLWKLALLIVKKS